MCVYTHCVYIGKIPFHFPKDLRASSFGRLLSHLVDSLMDIQSMFHLLDVSHYIFFGNLIEINISQHYSQVKVGISIL